ncbi:AMP-binding protein [Cumulibacter manganitolerans]|uniref:AMP-binding protein n=1 Tax=Cumulibacter manganitolerans TaxID=1884992 RepID=UPI001297269F|nr:AMP-binding protein [Cumulibacter manganitolerans]
MDHSLDHRRRVLADRHPEWRPRTLTQHLSECARSFPHLAYLIGPEREWSYRELRDWSRELAAGLLRAGIKPGEHVAMNLTNMPEFAAVKYAIAAVGAVAVPLNFRLRTEELRYVLGQSNSVALVTLDAYRDQSFLDALNSIAPGWRAGSTCELPRLRHVWVLPEPGKPLPGDVRRLDDLRGALNEETEARLDELEAEGDPMAISDIMYTSGTTGASKGVMLTHDSTLRSAASSAFIRALWEGQRTQFAMPLYHVFSYVEGLLATTFARGAVAPQIDFSPEEALRSIERHQIDEALFVPTMTVAILEHPGLADFDLSSLHGVMSASAPAPVRLWEQVRSKMGVREIVTAYGQTESSASTTYTLPGDALKLVSSTVGRAKFGYVAGVPELDGYVTAYRTIDPATGEVLAAGAEGELCLAGPQVMLGYYNKPDESAAVLTDDGWMRSGDLGRVREDGYLVLTGRSKELYKRGAELVAPREVEDLLSGRPDVSQVYVVGLPDERMGEIGCAYVILEPGAQLSEQAVIAYCKQHLARFKVPDVVRFISADQLPTTPTGKVQKFKLREMGERNREGELS